MDNPPSLNSIPNYILHYQFSEILTYISGLFFLKYFREALSEGNKEKIQEHLNMRKRLLFNTACLQGDLELLNHPEENLFELVEVHPIAVLSAAAEGNLEVLQKLLEKDQHCLDYSDDLDRTPLQMACRWGHLDAVEFILNHPGGFDQPITDVEGRSAFIEACEYGHYDIIQLLVASSSFEDPLFDEIYSHLPSVKWFLALSCDYENLLDDFATGAVYGGEEVFDLIRGFEANPERRRKELRDELGITGSLHFISPF